MRRGSPAWLAGLFATACSSQTPSGGCEDNSDCSAGQICNAGACATICRSDVDCPAATPLCRQNVCIAGAASDLPRIDAIDGNGAPDGAAGHTANHVRSRVTLSGANLEGASATLDGPGGARPLEVCGSAPTSLTLALPQDLQQDATYLLTVTTQAGSTCADLPVLQGEVGPAGPAGPAGVPCASCVDGASIADGAVGGADIAAGVISSFHLGSGAFGGSGSAPTASRSDHGHAVATPSADGMMSGADKSKLDGYSSVGGLTCHEEFDFTEAGTNTTTYWPSAAKRAELFAYGWICWDRSGLARKVNPTDTGIGLATGSYAAWDGDSTGGTDYRICGRVTYITADNNTDSAGGNPNGYILSWTPGYYFGLRYMRQPLLTWHGRWAAGGGEGSGGVTNLGDRWTIWTCR